MRGIQHRPGCGKPEPDKRQDEYAVYTWCPECKRAALIGTRLSAPGQFADGGDVNAV